MGADNPYEAPSAGLYSSGGENRASGTGIHGLDGLTREDLMRELMAGGRFVVFPYCISVLVVTFRRNSEVYFLRGGELAVVKGFRWILISLAAGWWGFPWGLIFTPAAILQNVFGGKNVTDAVLSALQMERPRNDGEPFPN